MEYREAVAEALRLGQVIEQAEATAEEAKWGRARLSWEQTRAAGKSGSQWARDIGVHPTSVNAWCRMWERWGEEALLNRPTFAKATEIIHGWEPGIEEHGSDYARKARVAVRNLPPEQKAAVMEELLDDEEATEQVISNPSTRAKIARVENRVDRQTQETAKERYELSNPRSVQIGAMADLEHALGKARAAFEDAREAADKMTAYNWPDNNRDRADVLVQRALAAGELCRAAIRGEDLDAELQELLKGGDV
jgi:hypothetical protein